MRSRAAVAVLLGLLANTAWANAGIGFLFPAAPSLLLALPPVIFIEAPVFAALLGLPIRTGLTLSASINVRSTLFGFLFAFVVDFGLIALTGGGMGPTPGRGPLLLALVPMFLFTVCIEDRAAARMHPELNRYRVSAATIVANVLSYAALWAVIVYTPAFRALDQLGYSSHVSFASGAADRWKDAVEKYWQSNKRFPERRDDLGIAAGEERRGVGRITLEPAGRIVLPLKFPADPELDGKRLIFEPQTAGGTLQWTCRTPDLAPRYTPYGCRDGDGGRDQRPRSP